MRYVIETSYPKNKFFNRKIFTPGWWGSTPYFEMSKPYSDGIGCQHVDLRIRNAGDDVDGNVIGCTHVRSGYVLVSKDKYQKALDEVSRDIENGNILKAQERLQKLKQVAGRGPERSGALE